MKIGAILSFLASCTLAIPSPRDLLFCFYMTSELNWEGEGQNLCNKLNTCSSKLPDGLTKQVSSAGPDQSIVCWLYSEQNCAGEQSPGIFWPGYANLNDIDFENKAQSWKCNYQELV